MVIYVKFPGVLQVLWEATDPGSLLGRIHTYLMVLSFDYSSMDPTHGTVSLKVCGMYNESI